MTFNQEAVTLVSDIPGRVSGSRRTSRALSPETRAFPPSGASPWFANCMEDAGPPLVPALVQFNFRKMPNTEGEELCGCDKGLLTATHARLQTDAAPPAHRAILTGHLCLPGVLGERRRRRGWARGLSGSAPRVSRALGWRVSPARSLIMTVGVCAELRSLWTHSRPSSGWSLVIKG